MNDRLEETNCPLCQSKSLTGKKYDFHPHYVVQCGDCGLWYLNPRVKEKFLLDIYKQDAYYDTGNPHGYTNEDGGYESRTDSIRQTSKSFLIKMKKLEMTGGSLLEVGCGYGYFLDAGKPYFEQLTGLDYSEKAINETKKRGVNTIHGGIEHLPPGKEFDTIIATNVIEHVYEPTPFVESLLRHLRPRGWLIFSTPMMNSFWRKSMGRRWPSFLTPEHVAYYDRQTLKHLFLNCGFTDLRPLSGSYIFPISLVGQKAGFSMPAWTGKVNLWMPFIMTALAGRKKEL